LGLRLNDAFAGTPILRIHVRPARSILSKALNLRRSAIAAFVRRRDGIARSARQEGAIR
jgi:hypothetical protein